MPFAFNPFTGAFDYYQSGSAGNSFTIWQPPAGTSPTAASASDTMHLTSSDSTVTITGNSSTDTLDFKLAKTPINADGSTSPSAAISWNSQNLTNLGNVTYAADGTKDIGVWNGNRAGNGSFKLGLNIGTAPDRQDGGVIECGSATSHMVQFGTINGMLPHTDGNVAFRDKAMGTTGELYGFGKASGSAVLRFFKFTITGNNQTDALTIDGATGNVRIVGNLGVGNSAAGSTLGSVVKKIQIFDASGTSLGYIPVYDAIT